MRLTRNGAATLALVLGVCACNADPAARDARSGAPNAGAASMAGDIRAMNTACDTAAASWHALAGVEVRRVDTTRAVLAAQSPRTGCLVTAYASKGVTESQSRSLYWSRDSVIGWQPLLEFIADGPDGGARTYERGPVRCQVDVEHDGGDDSDSTYMPKPYIRETTFCWIARTR